MLTAHAVLLSHLPAASHRPGSGHKVVEGSLEPGSQLAAFSVLGAQADSHQLVP